MSTVFSRPDRLFRDYRQVKLENLVEITGGTKSLRFPPMLEGQDGWQIGDTIVMREDLEPDGVTLIC